MPSGTERLRARPSRAERPGVGWCSCVPAAQQSAAPASPPLPPPRGLRWLASRPEGARSSGRVARPWAPPPPPLPGERPPRPAGPVCPRGCQSPCVCLCGCVCVCVSACQPPVSARATPATPGPRPSPHCPPPPPARCPGSFCQQPAPPGWEAPPLPPEAPPSASSVITPPPTSYRLQRPGGVRVPRLPGVRVSPTGHSVATRGLWRGSECPSMPARPCEGACPPVCRCEHRVCASEPGGGRGAGGCLTGVGRRCQAAKSHLLQLSRVPCVLRGWGSPCL